MARGGKRPNSGRKPEAMRRKQNALVAEILDSDMTPLDVMHRAMMEHVKAERWDDAAKQAKEAAPYVHPKLSSVEATGKGGGPLVVEIVNMTYGDED